MPLKNLFKRKKDKKKDAAKEAPSAAAKPAKGQGVNGDEVKKKLVTMVQLNDVTPNAQDGEFGNRGRFESYASGASSPSTS